MAKETENKVVKGKGGKIALVVCVVVIIALIGIVIYLITSRFGSENKKSKRNVVVNEKNVEKVISQIDEDSRTPMGSYEVTMNTTWNFENGSVASKNAYVKNAESNTNSVYFDVIRSDTGETILSSPILPVGTYLEKITLDTVLPAGTYDCVCTYHLIDDNEKDISKVNLTLKIVINN